MLSSRRLRAVVIATAVVLLVQWRTTSGFVSPVSLSHQRSSKAVFEATLNRWRPMLSQSPFDQDTSAATDRSWIDPIVSNPSKSIQYSLLMTACGAALGPFLDSYHSAFGVLQYEEPISAVLWGTLDNPALTTAWWVPELFGLAGFIIGWLYILLDQVLEEGQDKTRPSPPSILVCISIFTLQYWLSGVLFGRMVSRETILSVMSIISTAGFLVFDRSKSGFITSVATAICGPLIEVGLLSTLQGHGGYHYTDPGETGFFPLWIVPGESTRCLLVHKLCFCLNPLQVYFLGGPAVGNLGRGFWNWLSKDASGTSSTGTGRRRRPCEVCNDSRAVPCPNCDAMGYYVTYGQSVTCNACKGRGLVMCRACFSDYNEDPYDIEAVRDFMSKLPD